MRVVNQLGQDVTEPGDTTTGGCLCDLERWYLRFAQDRDWLQFHNPKSLSMAIAATPASTRSCR